MEYKKNTKKFLLAFEKKWEKKVLPTNGNLKPKRPPMFRMQKKANGQYQAVKLAI